MAWCMSNELSIKAKLAKVLRENMFGQKSHYWKGGIQSPSREIRPTSGWFATRNSLSFAKQNTARRTSGSQASWRLHSQRKVSEGRSCRHSPCKLVRLASILNNEPPDEKSSVDAFKKAVEILKPNKKLAERCIKLDLISQKCKEDVLRKINLMNTRATHNLSANNPIAKR